MWLSVELDAFVHHPPRSVYPYLADPETWPRWAPAVHSRRRLDGGPIRVGSRWASIDRIGPFKIHFTDIMDTAEPDERVVWHSTSPWNSRVEYVCAAEGDGTHVHALYEGDLAGWMALLRLMPKWVWRMILNRDFVGLNRLLDAQAVRVS